MNDLVDHQKYEDIKTEMAKEMTDKLVAQQDPRILGNGDIFGNYKYSGKVANFYIRYMSGIKSYLLGG